MAFRCLDLLSFQKTGFCTCERAGFCLLCISTSSIDNGTNIDIPKKSTQLTFVTQSMAFRHLDLLPFQKTCSCACERAGYLFFMYIHKHYRKQSWGMHRSRPSSRNSHAPCSFSPSLFSAASLWYRFMLTFLIFEIVAFLVSSR
jgi:hypothetical protein